MLELSAVEANLDKSMLLQPCKVLEVNNRRRGSCTRELEFCIITVVQLVEVVCGGEFGS
jgi:hypothetical protein